MNLYNPGAGAIDMLRNLASRLTADDTAEPQQAPRGLLGNIKDLVSNPGAYAEMLTDRLRNFNAGNKAVIRPDGAGMVPMTREERTAQFTQGALDNLGSGGLGALGVVKPRGGNWLSGKYGPERTHFRSLKAEEPAEFVIPRNVEEAIAMREAALAEAGKPSPLNTWIDKQLTKYIKNDMASPADPIRKLADAWPAEKATKLAAAEAKVAALRKKQEAQAATRGVPEEYLTRTRQEVLAAEEARDLIDANTGLHYAPDPYMPSETTSMRRVEEGFPAEGMAATDLGRAWEMQSDDAINPQKAAYFQLSNNLKQDPWLAKADPEARINTLMPSALGDTRLDHLVDELRNSLREGRLTPEQLGKMPIDQAVRHVAEVNALRAVKSRQEQAMDTAGMPLHKDYPEQGLSWRQLMSEDQDQLQKWLTQEGDAMGHCVGGYCDDVAEGRSSIYSLRDAKGRPYVTIETMPPDLEGPGSLDDAIGDRLWGEAFAKFGEEAEGTAPFMKYIEDGMREAAKNRVPMIAQIKGPKNESPDPKYFPQIQDFIRSGKWSNIQDRRHTGLTDAEIDQILKGTQ
jgi:hypothetical protein